MTERKPFDAAVRRLLDEQAVATGALPPAMTNEERVRMARGFMMRALESRVSIAGLPNGVETRDVEIAAGLGARVYVPLGDSASRPVVVYTHGGGWVVGAVATVDPFCRLLSEAAGVIIVSVEYRLAPEHPYPAALDDTLAAFEWVAEHAHEWGGDASRLALGGDSAGANLAAVIANRICSVAPVKEHAQALRALLLLYPVTDHPGADHPSYAENASGFGLEANLMRWFWTQYAPGVSADDPSIAPLRLREVPALPPTLVTTAHYDVLRDEGIAYAEKLTAAGVAVSHLHAPDMGHNFPVTPSQVARFPQGVETLGEIADWLRETLVVRQVR
ncbi:acetyl esterase [Paraburkholderia sp. GAS38]|uniref:alpha/beta hydrolase n=1 Tax=Paraburkholderia sp. GAS38 TaxID=3035133 RepID=UPI003D1E2CDA